MRKDPSEATVASPAQDKATPPTSSPVAASISQFLAKVFEQLSLSSWFPAAMLIGNGAVLLQLHADKTGGVSEAVRKLTEKPLGILLVVSFGLILTTMIVQAFEFEMIRLLEGYIDGGRGLRYRWATLRIKRHLSKLGRLEKAHQQAYEDAFIQAKPILLAHNHDRRLLEILENDVFQRTVTSRPKPKLVEQAEAIDWKRHVAPHVLHRIDALREQLNGYPDDHRLMPTRLGNALRSAEDQLELEPDEDLEGFVIRNHDRLPAAIRQEHKDFRTRLDMYCSLVLVFLTLAAGSIAALQTVAGPAVIVVTALAYTTMAWLSYEAAVASARGYGNVLLEISRFINADQPDTAPERRSLPARFAALFHRDLM